MTDKNTGRSYVQIYVDAMRRAIRELCPLESDVLDFLVSRADEYGVCFPGIADIAKGIDARCEDVIAAIEALATKGYVLYVRKDERDPITRRQLLNAYQISLDYLAVNPDHYPMALEIAQNAFHKTTLLLYDSKITRESGIITTDRNQLRSTKHLQEPPTGSTDQGTNHRQEAPLGSTTESFKGGADAPQGTPDGVKAGIPGEPDDLTGEGSNSAEGTNSAERNENSPPNSAPPPSQKSRWLKEPPAAGYAVKLDDSRLEALANEIHDLVAAIHSKAVTSISASRCLVYNYPLHAGIALIRLRQMRITRPHYEIKDAMALLTYWTNSASGKESSDQPTVENEPDVLEQFEKQRWAALAVKPNAIQPSSRITPEMVNAWRIASNQLELQLDKANFDTWLRGVEIIDFADGVYFFAARSHYACEQLQHRLYRPIWRVFTDVMGFEDASKIELRFVSPDDAQQQTEMAGD